MANTFGMEQRSKYQNEITKKKRIGNYPNEPNRRQGVSGGTIPLSMGTPSATSTKAPIIDTESDDDVSFSVVDTRKMALVDDTMNVTEGVSTEIDFEGMSQDTRMLPSMSPDNLGISPTKIHSPSLPVKVQFGLCFIIKWSIDYSRCP